MDTDLTIADQSKAISKSGYFQDARDPDQAVVKILAGRELGLGPIASMTGVYIVKGRVTPSANLVAGLIKRSGRYTYKVKRLDATGCEIQFFERDGRGWEPTGTSSFTMQDAKAAGLGGTNWSSYPRNMLFARAMSNGAKWYCPDVFGGPVYTPDELGESGEVIDAGRLGVVSEADELVEALPGAVVVEQEPIAEPEPTRPSTNGNGATMARPLAPDNLRALLAIKAKGHGRDQHTASAGQRGLLVGVIEEIFAGQPEPAECRHDLLRYLTGSASSKELPDAMVHALLDWLKPAKDDGGAWLADGMAVREAREALAMACRVESRAAPAA